MRVRENPVKPKLGSGEVAMGTMFFEFASPGRPASGHERGGLRHVRHGARRARA